MARGPGRDQVAPMERIVRIITLLNNASETPTPAQRLVEVGGYRTENPESARRMLNRDIDQLNVHGWDIRNLSSAGEPARYQMFARDNRLQVRLEPAQRAELVRAAMALDRPELAHQLGLRITLPEGGAKVARVAAPAALDAVLRAVSRRCRLRFTYKDLPREVHPYAVHPGPSGWYLRARETEREPIKEFVIHRMRGVVLDRPGTAEPVRDAPRLQLDPLTWRQDPPIEVVLETGLEHRGHVERLLGEPREVTKRSNLATMAYDVTNRAAFRWRVYELGLRVRVVGPAVLRDEIRRELTAIAEAAA